MGEVIHDNERLEFLGDAVLDLVVGEYLFLKPTWPEGNLTRAKASAGELACALNAPPPYRRLHVHWAGEEMSGVKNESHPAMPSKQSSVPFIWITTTKWQPASSWAI